MPSDWWAEFVFLALIGRFVSSKSGHILEVDYAAVAIKNVRRVLPTQPSHGQRREKQTFSTG